MDDEQDETGDDAAEEPPNGPNRPTGWASVPTSGIPTISGSAAVTGMAKPGADTPKDDQRDMSRPGVGLPPGSFPSESNGANGRAAAGLPAPVPGAGPSTTGGANGRPGVSVPAADSPAPGAGTLVTPISGGDPTAKGAGDELRSRQHPGGTRRLASLADAEAVQPRAGRRNADPVRAGSAAGGDARLRPGDVNLSQITFWDEEAITHFRSEWHEVKACFVDDPVSALTRAHDLLTDAVNELSEALLAERDELDPLRNTSTPDTESMRMAMRGYREFMDRILAL